MRRSLLVLTVVLGTLLGGLALNVAPAAPANAAATLNATTGLPSLVVTGDDPAPVVSSVSPASGPSGGGTAVSLTGTDFVAGATVTIGGMPATSVTVVSPTTITAVTPGHAAGAVDVVVTNLDTQAGTLFGGFTYLYSLVDLTPAAPLLTGNFRYPSLLGDGTNLKFWYEDRTDSAKIKVRSSTSGYTGFGGATATTGLTGLGHPRVYADGAGGYVGYFWATAATPPNNIVRLTSSDGLDWTGSTPLTIAGSPFPAAQSWGVVGLFENVDSTTTDVLYFTQAIGANEQVYRATATDGLTFTYTGEAFVNPGGVYGAGVSVGSQILFDPSNDQYLMVWSGESTVGNIGYAVSDDGVSFTNLGTVVTSNATHNDLQESSFVINNGDGLLGVYTGDFMPVTANGIGAYALPAPTVSGIAPGEGSIAGGTAITLTGTGFVPGSTVTIGGQPAVTVTITRGTSIEATTPAHAAGPVDVIVTAPSPGGITTVINGFTYLNPAPTAVSIAPAVGPTAGGTAVTLTGTGFVDGATVMIGGNAATSVSVVSPTSITAVTPGHAAGVVDVVVTNPDTQTGTLPSGFTYVAAPSVVTGAASSVTVSGATLNGSVNANGADTSALTIKYDTDQAVVDAGGGTSAVVSPSSASGVDVTPVSAVVSGLLSNTQYFFRVSATNAGGQTNGGTASFVTLPGAPTGVAGVLTGTAGAVAVSWTSPSGGGELTGYAVTATPAGAGVAGSCVSTGAPAATSCVVSGLTVGETYTFTAVATNASGTSVASDPSVPLVVVGPAGAPTSLVGEPLQDSASVAFIPPVDAGGGTITNYEYSLDGGVTWIPRAPASSTSPMVVSGLSNGVAYQIAVRAVNEFGGGTASAPVSVTIGVPTAPRDVVVNAGDASAAVGFTPPEFDGGSPIINYEYSIDGGVTWVTYAPPWTFSPLPVWDLVNGTTYMLQVCAVNAVGRGVCADAGPVTPSGVPLPPTDLVATPGNGTASVAFTPGADGGTPVTDYEYSLDAGATWTSAGTAVSPVLVSGLTNGTAYDVVLRSVTANGPSEASAAVSVTPRTTMGAPSLVVTSVGDSRATIEATGGDDGGSPLTNWAYSFDSGATWIALDPAYDVNPATFEVFGFTNGVPTEFGMRTINAAGSGAPSFVTITTYTTPSAPSVTSVSPGDGSASVVFTAGADGGSALTNYEYSVDGGSSWVPRSPVSTVSPLQITGLSNGTGYQVAVRGVNAAGVGAASNVVSVTPRTSPSAPTITSVSPGNASASVVFTAPVSDGGAALSNYEYSVDGGTTWSPRDPASTVSPLAITGLVNGTAYSVAVRGVNAAGAGAVSNVVGVTPRTVPGAPTAVGMSAGNSQVSVSWSAPVSDGGAAVSQYRAYVYAGATFVGQCRTSASPPAVPATSCVVSGLTPGVAYTVLVRAGNVAGLGASGAGGPVTVKGVPTAPTITASNAGDRSVAVTFTAANPNGGTMSNYQYSTDGGGTWRAFTPPVTSSPVIITTTSATNARLVNGTTYSVCVRGVNEFGAGAPSNCTSVTPPAVPSAPTITGVTRGNASAQVAFSPPASDGGLPVSSYQVRTQVSGTGVWSGWSALAGTVSPQTVSGLVNGTSYVAQIRAVNARGAGAVSNTSGVFTPLTVPGAPTGVTGVHGDGQVTWSWTAPASDGGAPITQYRVYVYAGAIYVGQCRTTASPPATPATSCVVSGLSNGTAYTVLVRAGNTVGLGASGAGGPITPSTVPDPPIVTSVTGGDESATVVFDTPADGGAPITMFEYTLDGGTSWVPGGASPLVLGGLSNGTTYQVGVRAVNLNGPGDPSVFTPVTPSTVPDPPTAVTGVHGNTTITVSWTAPADTGGLPLSGFGVCYTVSGSGDLPSCVMVGPADTSLMLTGLTNGTAYDVTVTAGNANGNSTAAAAANNPLTPSTVPGAPTGATGIPGDTTIAATWTAPADDGGSAVTNYRAFAYEAADPLKIPVSACQSTTGTPITPGCSIPGLINGVAYRYEVRAGNINGLSIPSAASGDLTPVGP